MSAAQTAIDRSFAMIAGLSWWAALNSGLSFWDSLGMGGKYKLSEVAEN